jgi:hypothetical protein
MLLYLALVKKKNVVPKAVAEEMERIPADVVIENPSVTVTAAIKENKIER